MTESEADILVVGGGPVGLAAAALLGRLGHRVLVLEQREAPVSADESRAITWMPEGLLLAEHLGIRDELAARALVRRSHEFRRSPHGAPLLTLRLDRMRHRHPYSLNLPQHDTEVVLESAALAIPGVRVLRGFAVESLSQHSAGVEVRGRRRPGAPEVARARFGVVADGASSTRRGGASMLRIGQRFRDYGTYSAVADVQLRADPDRNDRSWIALDPHRPLGAFAFGPGRWRLVYRVDSEEERRRAVEPDFVEEMLRRAYPNAVLERPLWASTFRLGQGQADRYSRDRWVLVGDAAHAMGPSAGAGMMVGLLGAWRLEVALRRHGIDAWDGAVADYEAGQRRVAERVQAANAMIFRNIALRNPAVGGLRAAGLWLAGHAPLAAARMTQRETLSGLAPASPADAAGRRVTSAQKRDRTSSSAARY